MLAGNVTASVDGGGNLNVRGDNLDNGVFISQVGPGQYQVTGFGLGGSPTRINGSEDATVLLTRAVRGNINVDLKGGNDALGIGNSAADLITLAENCGIEFGTDVTPPEDLEGQFFVPKSLIVNTGDGNDGMAISADVRFSVVINTGNGDDGVALGNLGDDEIDSLIGDNVVILTGKGDDDVCVTFVTLQGHLNIQTGDGLDEVKVDEVDAGHALLITGNGNDAVTMDRFDTDRELILDTGAGDDSALLNNFTAGQGFGPRRQTGAGLIKVVTGKGLDEVGLTAFQVDNVIIDTGDGNDTVGVRGDRTDEADVTRSLIRKNLNVNVGSGDDSLVFNDLNVLRDVFAFLGSGMDVLEANNDIFGNNLLVDAGSGDDNVTLDTVDVSRNATILLGSGNDNLTILGGSTNGKLIVRGGSGQDTFNNDREITGNGSSSSGDVREFEEF